MRARAAAVRLLGAVATAALSAVLLAVPARADVVGPCFASIAGRSMSGHDSAGSAIKVDYHRPVSFQGRTTDGSDVGRVDVRVDAYGAGGRVARDAGNGMSWSGSVSVRKYAWAGIGLYRVSTTAFAPSGRQVCAGSALVCIQGKSPFSTAAGAAGSAFAAGGLVLAVAGLLRRRRASPAGNGVRMGVGGGLGGLGAAVLLQQSCAVAPVAGVAAGLTLGGAAALAVVGAAVASSGGPRRRRRLNRAAAGRAAPVTPTGAAGGSSTVAPTGVSAGGSSSAPTGSTAGASSAPPAGVSAGGGPTAPAGAPGGGPTAPAGAPGGGPTPPAGVPGGGPAPPGAPTPGPPAGAPLPSGPTAAVVGAAAGAGALAAGAGAELAWGAASSQSVFRFDPGPEACEACRDRAARRLYRTWDAIQGDRAHKGCSCMAVVDQIDQASYAAYFAGGRDVYERPGA
jgi:hypothetical protein